MAKARTNKNVANDFRYPYRLVKLTVLPPVLLYVVDEAKKDEVVD